ncbi:MAG: helix-turn-helix transcriptional regulator [Clostridia bacterium]|nr:helix-turn-helix transcriptional regulator [Clostridia bacterium]
MKQSDSDKNLSLLKQVYSEILILRRNELGYTQKEAAEKCGITTKQYSNIERRECLPGSQTSSNMKIALVIDLNKVVDLAVEKGYFVTDKYK